MLWATMFFFSSENKKLFKNLNEKGQIFTNYYLCKNLFELTWKNAGTQSQVVAVTEMLFGSFKRYLNVYYWTTVLSFSPQTKP